MKIEYIILAIIAIIIVYFIIIFNIILKYSKKIERSKANIDVYLKKRYDLIPSLVEITKATANYESTTLERITKLRNEFTQNHSENIISELNTFCNKMIAIIEKYPELKLDGSFQLLQKELIEIEDDISALRRILNNNITSYNNLIKRIPNNFIAKILNYSEYSYPEYQYDNININF